MHPLDNTLLAILPTSKSTEGWMPTPRLIDRLKSRGHPVDYPKQIVRRLQALETEGLIVGRKIGRMLEWQRKEGINGFSRGFMPLEEALALQLLDRFSTRQLPMQAREHLQALFSAAQDRLQQAAHTPDKHYTSWSRKVDAIGSTFQLKTPTVSADVFSAVVDALFKEQMLTIRYRGMGQPSIRQHVVMPLGLVDMNGLTYLITRTQSRGKLIANPTKYRLDRIAQAESSDEAFVYPADFSLADYIHRDREMDFHVEEVTQVDLRVSAELGALLRETPLPEMKIVEEHENGSMTLSANIAPSLSFHKWLLGHGSDLEVLAPPFLRKQMRRQIKKMNHLYR